ncbi:hypothetical protein [Kocuria sp. SM24M-10]|uniref:hypothetical protein n=1 Tax=Kocuria sp. SM24M-10 TaxID=1660349 RepID=UPI00064A7C53|nr:hypothetical protein [Kocuria sp. SM24M-10]KLU08088.1 hypothetical protein ABL57_19845 [Kocuria sp. SM24M-10]
MSAEILAPADEVKRGLRARALAEHVAAVVNDWPPLTDEQLQRVAALLTPTAAPGPTGGGPK